MKELRKIVITGVESSGKSTLSKALANVLDAHLVNEYAREYLTNKKEYVQSDLKSISEGQIKLMNEPTTKKIKICDTDLQVIKIWSLVKYSMVDEFIVREYMKNLPDLYVLCIPDFDWEFDPLRENRHNQNEIHQLYLNELEQLGVPCITVEGGIENRKNAVLTFIKNNFT